MKIVQSFWAKPIFDKGQSNNQDRKLGGWFDIKFFYMGMTLSCLKLNSFYKEVELVTDEKGKEILIDGLKLPYTNVVNKLDSLNHYPPSVWAVGKIFAYSLQTKPFLHVDSDIMIWQPFPSYYDSLPLICQNLEVNFPYYDKMLNIVLNKFNYVPDCIKNFLKVDYNIIAANAGILGGCDTSFFQKYTTEAFDFIDKNLSCINELPFGGFNVIFEQLLFYCLAFENGQIIETLKKNQNQFFTGIANINQVPFNQTFVHPLANYKKMELLNKNVAIKLKQEFPDYYYKVEEYCNN